MKVELRGLAERIARVAGQVEEVREGVRRAVTIVDTDPAMALIRVRKVLEHIVRDLTEKRLGKAPGTRPLENLLHDLKNHIPQNLGAYAHSIKELGNLGAHGRHEKVSDADLYRALMLLLPILEWYFGKQASPAAPGSEPEGPPPSAALAPPPPEQVPWKQAGLLERRLITELTVLLAQAGAQAAPHLPGLLTWGLALYDELLLEPTHSSTLQQQLHRENRALGDVLLLIRSSRMELADDFRFALDESAEQWAADPQFQLAVGRYERGKGANTSAAPEASDYVHRVLELARAFDAAILPHPARWPLFRHVLDHCVWASAPGYPCSTVVLPATPLDPGLNLPSYRQERLPLLAERFGTPAPSPLALVRYGPTPHPFPPSILCNYRAADLKKLGTFAYEFLVPAE